MIDEGLPHVMVVPPEVIACLTVENSHATRFDVSGPEGPALLRQNMVTVMNPSSQYSETTYVINNFLLPPETEVNPMRHYEEIMEHITMIDSTPASVQFNPVTLGRGIYCSRGWRKLTFEDAIENLPIWDDKGTVRSWDPANRLGRTKPINWFGYFPYVPVTDDKPKPPVTIGDAFSTIDPTDKSAITALRKFMDGVAFDMSSTDKAYTAARSSLGLATAGGTATVNIDADGKRVLSTVARYDSENARENMKGKIEAALAAATTAAIAAATTAAIAAVVAADAASPVAKTDTKAKRRRAAADTARAAFTTAAPAEKLAAAEVAEVAEAKAEVAEARAEAMAEAKIGRAHV
jgi:hypothetical protein